LGGEFPKISSHLAQNHRPCGLCPGFHVSSRNTSHAPIRSLSRSGSLGIHVWAPSNGVEAPSSSAPQRCGQAKCMVPARAIPFPFCAGGPACPSHTNTSKRKSGPSGFLMGSILLKTWRYLGKRVNRGVRIISLLLLRHFLGTCPMRNTVARLRSFALAGSAKRPRPAYTSIFAGVPESVVPGTGARGPKTYDQHPRICFSNYRVEPSRRIAGLPAPTADACPNISPQHQGHRDAINKKIDTTIPPSYLLPASGSVAEEFVPGP